MTTIPPIISVDDHIIEPPDLFTRWLPAKYRDAGPHVVRVPWELGPGVKQSYRPAASGPECDCWMFGDIPQFVSSGTAAAGFAPDEIDANLPRSYADMRPGFYDPVARLADMDVINVERSLCFPNVIRFCGQMFLWMAEKDPELALASLRAYNDWLVEEWCGPSGGRLLPVGLVPLWDPLECAAEVRRNAARGTRAVAFCELPAALGLPSIHSRAGEWLPLFQACDETGTVVCQHIGSSSALPNSSPDAPTVVRQVSGSFNAALALTDWLVSGLLPRFPNLKVALSEGQIGWMPFVLERIDRLWENAKAVSEFPKEVTEPPSSYVSGRIYGCMFADDSGIAGRDAIGIDAITYETDYPHQDSLWPNTMVYVEKALAGLADDEVHAIVRGNAIRMLDLPEHLPSE